MISDLRVHNVQGRRYLLRLINTSTASTFVFSIDKHILQVVAMDFVPIEPYVSPAVLPMLSFVD